ncbi:cytochrome c oxidase subunit 4 [Citricoccus sp. SGAir0253]|uniref:cytochrome c oxidase subunit 4 n=1 Tax=Citricoccus sp. SGAir0253 TaxID=2567881 RepID=UPI0010CD31B3|nr:cytochrome c oxidase subunit 4 [Citricoccus sp. SGAir0253]QCU78022.1 cytochrome c oxidase subunit 4 [Citricoccus sp. SGAir0253]
MRTSVKLFTIIATFFVIVGTVYAFWVRWSEWAGIPAIYALAGLGYMIALYLWLTERRFGLGPDDDENGEISAYAGTYGNFAPWSWWPLGLGIACAALVLGLAVGWWIFFVGVGLGLYFLVGWVFEYSKGQHAH